jgi:hypothetical protein
MVLSQSSQSATDLVTIVENVSSYHKYISPLLLRKHKTHLFGLLRMGGLVWAVYEGVVPSDPPMPDIALAVLTLRTSSGRIWIHFCTRIFSS